MASEHGKFRYLLINNASAPGELYENLRNPKELSLELIEDLHRNIDRENNDLKTIAFGLVSRDRKEIYSLPDFKRMYTAHKAGNVFML